MSRAQGEKRASVLRRGQMSEARPAGTLPVPPGQRAVLALGRVIETDLSGEVPVHTVELVMPGSLSGTGLTQSTLVAVDGSEIAADKLVRLARYGTEVVLEALDGSTDGTESGGGSADNVIYSVNRAPLFQA